MEIIRPWKANRDDVHPTQFFTPQRLNKNEWPCLHSAWSFSVANSDSCLSFLSFVVFPGSLLPAVFPQARGRGSQRYPMSMTSSEEEEKSPLVLFSFLTPRGEEDWQVCSSCSRCEEETPW